MDLNEFSYKINGHISKPILQFFVNINNLKKSLDLTGWSFHIFSEDLLQHFPEEIDSAPVSFNTCEEV